MSKARVAMSPGVGLRERLANLLLLLYTIKRTSEVGALDGMVKLQKLVFLPKRS